MALLSDVVIDCEHPAPLARFWAAALDGYTVAPYGDDELARLRSIGVDDPEDDPTVVVESAAGPRLWFQRVPEPKVAKNRLHLDLRAVDPDAEAERLLGLGARMASEQPNGTLIGLHDPEGNEFCILR